MSIVCHVELRDLSADPGIEPDGKPDRLHGCWRVLVPRHHGRQLSNRQLQGQAVVEAAVSHLGCQLSEQGTAFRSDHRQSAAEPPAQLLAAVQQGAANDRIPPAVHQKAALPSCSPVDSRSQRSCQLLLTCGASRQRGESSDSSQDCKDT
jgi:hypothetical protein